LLRDAVLLILSTKGLKDIKTSHGKIVLKDELLMRLNSFLSTGLIRNIYFTSFVIQ
jgi:flagellar FliL protein